MPKFKLSALVSLVLVFLSGVLVGGVAIRLYMVRSVSSTSIPGGPPAQRKQSPEEVRQRLVNEMRTRVHLDDHQVQQLQTIFDQTRERFDDLFHKRNQEARALWERQNEEIRQILRPDQLPQYEQLRAEREAHRRERDREEREGRGGRGRGPR